MAYCSQTIQGIAQDCASNVGGVKKIYIGAYPESGAPFTVAEGVVTAVTSGIEWHTFNFKKGTASMTSTLNVDSANGTNYVSTELVMQFNRMETAKRIAISALALSDVCAIVEDANGNRYALGISEPVNATAGTGQTGQAKGDGNFYSITLTDEHGEFPALLKADLTVSPVD